MANEKKEQTFLLVDGISLESIKNTIFLKSMEDILRYTQKSNNKDYCFKETVRWEEKNITITEIYSVFDIESRILFRFEKHIVDDATREEFDLLNAQLYDDTDEPDESDDMKIELTDEEKNTIRKVCDEYLNDLKNRIAFHSPVAVNYALEAVQREVLRAYSLLDSKKGLIKNYLDNYATQEYQRTILGARREKISLVIDKAVSELKSDQKYYTNTLGDTRIRYIESYLSNHGAPVLEKKDKMFIMQQLGKVMSRYSPK